LPKKRVTSYRVKRRRSKGTILTPSGVSASTTKGRGEDVCRRFKRGKTNHRIVWGRREGKTTRPIWSRRSLEGRNWHTEGPKKVAPRKGKKSVARIQGVLFDEHVLT